MRLKRINLLLTLAVALAVLTGCTGEGASETVSDGELSLAKELKLTVWETQGTDYVGETEISNDIVAKWLHQETNVKVENIYGNDGGQWDVKLSKLVAGNNLPNIVHCGAGQGAAHFAKLDQLGKVRVLTPEVIQKYAPNLWARTAQDAWDDMTVDGKILGVPYSSLEPNKTVLPLMSDDEMQFLKDLKMTYSSDVRFSALQSLWIRDDILKEYFPDARMYDELVTLIDESQTPIGDELLDIPITSTEQFIDFMYQIKEDHPTEGGKQAYAFGYSGGDNWIALTWLGADMYGYKGHNYAGTWNSATERMEIPLVKSTVRKAAKTQNQMINDGVIDPESLAHNTSLFKEKILAGQYIIAPLEAAGLPTEINAQLEKAGKSFRFRPFLTQVPALAEYSPFKTETKSWSESICFLNTLSESELYQVLNWIDVQYSDKFDEVKNWGTPEDDLYTENPNGTRSFKDERFTKYFLEGDTSALSKDETLGLQGKGSAFGVYAFDAYSRWTPAIMYKYAKYEPLSRSGFKFKSDSEHVVNLPLYPPTEIWDSAYANIPEVIEFWAQREQWENMVKLAISSKKEDFDASWDKMIKSVNEIANIDDMENAMTEIAKPIADGLKE